MLLVSFGLEGIKAVASRPVLDGLPAPRGQRYTGAILGNAAGGDGARLLFKAVSLAGESDQ